MWPFEWMDQWAGSNWCTCTDKMSTLPWFAIRLQLGTGTEQFVCFMPCCITTVSLYDLTCPHLAAHFSFVGMNYGCLHHNCKCLIESFKCHLASAYSETSRDRIRSTLSACHDRLLWFIECLVSVIVMLLVGAKCHSPIGSVCLRPITCGQICTLDWPHDAST